MTSANYRGVGILDDESTHESSNACGNISSLRLHAEIASVSEILLTQNLVRSGWEVNAGEVRCGQASGKFRPQKSRREHLHVKDGSL
jgi:hypothetical protein